jgi:phage gp36-like protein
MSNWIVTTDYKPYVRDAHLSMIIDNDAVALDSAELTAIQVVKDALHQWYDVDAIFGTSGSSRPPQVLRWCITLVLYYLYERVPDKLTPERVIKNYDEAIELLGDISDGKLSVDLPRKIASDGSLKTKFRWGSVQPREHGG